MKRHGGIFLHNFGKLNAEMIALNFEKRVSLLYGVLVLASFLLLARLYNLSRPATNESLSVLDGQYTARIEVCSRSGFIYDRNGNLLSHEKTGCMALVNPAVCNFPDEYAKVISDNAQVSRFSDIYEKLEEGIPFTVMLDEKYQKEFFELVKEKGLKLDAAQAQLNRNRKNVDKTFEVVDRLKLVRENLIKLQSALESMK